MLPNFGQLANGDRRGARGHRAQRAVEGRGVGDSCELVRKITRITLKDTAVRIVNIGTTASERTF